MSFQKNKCNKNYYDKYEQTNSYDQYESSDYYNQYEMCHKDEEQEHVHEYSSNVRLAEVLEEPPPSKLVSCVAVQIKVLFSNVYVPI